MSRALRALLVISLLGSLLAVSPVALMPASAKTDTGPKVTVMTPNADATKASFTAIGCGTAFWDCIDESVGNHDVNTTALTGTSNANVTFSTELTDMPADFGSAQSVRFNVAARNYHSGASLDGERFTLQLMTGNDTTPLTAVSSSTGLLSGNFLIFKFDVAITGTNTKATFDAARVLLTGTYTSSGSNHTGTQIRISALDVAVTYLPTSNLPKLNQDRYIWENDDEDQVTGDAADDNTQQAPGNTPLTGVARGERLTTRIQVRNTGNALADRDLALFYDHGDGIWAKVQNNAPLMSSAATCADTTSFECVTVETGSSPGQVSSVAVDSAGAPWVASRIGTGSGLRLARHVGSMGNCANGVWMCETVYNSGTSGDSPSLAIDSSNRPWISFIAGANDLYVARYVGTGGSGCTGTTDTGAWICTAVDAAANVTGATSIGIDSSGYAAVSYYDSTASDLKVARFNGTTWALTSVDTTVNGGTHSSLAFDQAGNIWVSYYDIGNTRLKVAQYTSSWALTTVDTGPNVGQYSSIAIAPDGNPWISYYDAAAANLNLKLAKYSGSAWSASTVDTTGDVGMDSSLAFAPDGNPWIVSYDNTSGKKDLRLTRYDGSTWSGSSIDSTGDVGVAPDLAFDVDGSAWISSYSAAETGLKVLHSARSGEIVGGIAVANGHNDAINESHTDMTTVTDTAARDTANCSVTGTWNAGKAADGTELNGLTLPVGSTTAQCTEISFVLDTSSAVAGQQYRFVVASRDGWRTDRGQWRGPVSVGAYPTLTMGTSNATVALKGTEPVWNSCSNTAYQCVTAGVPAGFGGSLDSASLALGPDGNVWTAYTDFNGGNQNLNVARYVGGTSGTGCSGTTAWSCYVVESVNNVGFHPWLLFSPDGTPWIAYHANPGGSSDVLRVAHYVGTGGTGCQISSWTCTSVEAYDITVNQLARKSMAFDPSGALWIAYRDNYNNDLWVAQYVGANGVGCDDPAWSCTRVHTTGNGMPGIAIDSSGAVWINVDKQGSSPNAMMIARHVGHGGTGCSSTAWTCTFILGASGTLNGWGSMAIDKNNVPWATVRYNGKLHVAHYVGSNGSGCDVSDWTCEQVDSGSVGEMPSIAIAPDNTKWISYTDAGASNALKVAHSVSGAGSGCGGSGWVCETAQTSGGGNTSTSIAIDPMGIPYIYWTASGWAVTIVRPAANPTRPGVIGGGGSATSSRSADGHHALSSGYSPRSTSTCAATAGNMGYCGIGAVDSNYDSMTAQLNEQPIYTFASAAVGDSEAPTITWTGKSSVAPSSKAISVQVWNEATASWTTLTPASDTCTSTAANTDCTIVAQGNGAGSAYHQYLNGAYWSYFRVSQAANTTAETLSTNYVSINRAPQPPTFLAQTKTNGTSIPGTALYSYDASVGSSVDAYGAPAATLSIDTATKRTGAGSLKAETTNAGVTIKDGNVGTRNLTSGGTTFSAWVYVPSGNSGGTWQGRLSVFDPGGVSHDGPQVSIARNTWTLLTYAPLPSLLANMTHLAVSVDGGSGGTDTVYVDDFSQGAGIWTNETSVRFTAMIGDYDTFDTNQLCIEVKPIGSAFDNSEDSCESGAAFSGTTFSRAHTLNSLGDGSQYHWQARTKDAKGTYSGWVTYGGNDDAVTASPDFGIDTSAPTAGAVFDGDQAGVDADFNDGSLSELSGNWSGFGGAGSEVVRYEYSIGTSAGGTDVVGWTATNQTEFTASGLTLTTEQSYFVNVKAIDAFGTASSVVSSNGQQVPNPQVPVTFSFGTSSNALDFGYLSAGNSYTSLQGFDITTTLNTNGGYVVRQRVTTDLSSGSRTIPWYSSGYDAPTTWTGTGFGYTSTDASIALLGNIFGSGTKYAAPSAVGNGDIVADHVMTLPGGPINETYRLDYKVSVPVTASAGTYSTAIILTAIPDF